MPQLTYTLRRLHTYGRESLTSLLTALRLLEESPLPVTAIQAALERVIVTNAADADRLLACMQALDKMREEEADGTDQQGDDPEP